MNRIYPLLALLSAWAVFGCDSNDDGEACGEERYRFHQPLALGVTEETADPDILKVGDAYYLYATHTTEGQSAWRSYDLQRWEALGVVWRPTEGTWNARNDSCGVWAPHVHPTEEGFYLYYVANCRIGVAFSRNPEGPFEDLLDHPLIGDGYGGVGDGENLDQAFNIDDFAIDPFILPLEDGRWVLYFNKPVACMYAIELADPATPVDADPTEVLCAQPDSWEEGVTEGAWVIPHQGRYHLMYSGNSTFTDDYAIGVATADDPFGPFQRYPHNPIWEKDEARGIISPGHHSVVEGLCGERLIFYHTKDGERDAGDRRIRYARLLTDENGRFAVEGF